MSKQSRREFLLNSATSAAAIGAGLSYADLAQAAETIVAVEWGGSYIDNMRKLAASQSDVQVNWQLHAGGAVAILPKIKSMWPKPGIDLLAGYDASWQTVAREGWAEPVTLQKVPNLADVPTKLLVKDSGGHIINIPRTISANIWFVREDICPIPINKVEDLLDPRLKGKICWPVPTLGANLQVVTMALHKGGNERNMQAGWDFLKALAKTGNIGRVANADTDISSSITSGETCIAFGGATAAARFGKTFKIKSLSKMPPDSGFKTFVYHEGWCVLKGGNTNGAFKFANYAISREANERFNLAINGVPANTKAKAAPEIQHIVFTNEEFDRHVYIPDWAFLSAEINAWNKRWEQEIQPLL